MRIGVLILLLLFVLPLPVWAQCWVSPISNPAISIVRSPSHQALGESVSATISPINGKNTMIGIGMSGSSGIYDGFRPRWKHDPEYVGAFKFYNGTKAGHGLESWALADSPWDNLEKKHGQWGISASDVQAMIVVQTLSDHSLPESQYVSLMQNVLLRIEADYPNVRIIYVASMYSGKYEQSQSHLPEPRLHGEIALVQQVQDTWGGSSWIGGLTFWSDGSIPNNEGFALDCEHVAADGAHLSRDGEIHTGRHLDALWNADTSTHGWMIVGSGPPPPPPPPPTLYKLFTNGLPVLTGAIQSAVAAAIDWDADTNEIQRVP